VWRKKYGGGKGAKLFVDTHEYILIYGKNKTNLLFNPLARNEKQLEAFKFEDEYVKERGKYYTRPLKSGLDERKTLVYPIECPDGSIIETQWICARETFQQLKDEGRIVFKLLKNKKYNVYKKFYENDMSGVLQESIIYDLAFNADAKLEIKKLFNIDEGRDTPFSAPKPEKLLQRILELTTQENDLVMDFFAGSGTTLAVAMKMKRQFIGIEQMDYIESITKERLKKVINGEQGGISKALNWQGGGSFIYAELMPLNVAYKERIKNINDEKELEKLYNDLESKAFLDYRIDLDSILKDKEFKELDLQNKQEALLKILDSNMDYVLYGDIDDRDYAISDETIELNKIFYGDCHDFANAKSRNDKKGK
ncbi:DNA methyltransferase, partial [Campylobacter upsaliensis]